MRKRSPEERRRADRTAMRGMLRFIGIAPVLGKLGAIVAATPMNVGGVTCTTASTGVVVGVVVATTITGVVVATGVGGTKIGATVHDGRVTVLESRVTAPLWARRRPSTEAPVVSVMEAEARTVPFRLEFAPSVAELPTCQKTLQA